MVACVGSGRAVSHTQESLESIYNGDNYETTLAGLDSLAQNAGDGKLIILIGRLGHGESSRKLNRSRLHLVRNALVVERRIPRKRVAFKWWRRLTKPAADGATAGFLSNLIPSR